MPSRHNQRRKVNREHAQSIMAVHKETGLFFGGKGTGTHIGYPKKHFLKAAMKEAGVNQDDYYYMEFSMKDNVPKLTLLEGSPNNMYHPEEENE